jgi:hypothetical protein
MILMRIISKLVRFLETSRTPENLSVKGREVIARADLGFSATPRQFNGLQRFLHFQCISAVQYVTACDGQCFTLSSAMYLRTSRISSCSM